MTLLEWKGSVRKLLKTSRPEVNFDDLDQDACEVAYHGGVSPKTFAALTTLPMKREHATGAVPKIGDGSGNRGRGTAWLLAAVAIGVVIFVLGVRSGQQPAPTSVAQSTVKGSKTYKFMSARIGELIPQAVGPQSAKGSGSTGDQDAPKAPVASDDSDLPPEPLPTPIHHLEGSVNLADASLSVENDGEGHEQAVGQVLIQNTGDYAITDFRLTLEEGTTQLALIPYEGSDSSPSPVFSRRIEPGGSLVIPVMTDGTYPTDTTPSLKQIHIQATVDGTPRTVTASATVL